jgi:hypothetical protein
MHFTLPPEALTQSVKQAADRLFITLLDPVIHTSFDTWRQTLDLGFLQPSEVRSAIHDLQLQGETLNPNLQASLDFAKGLNATNLAEALVLFEQSLRFWQEEERRGGGEQPILKVGLLLMHIGRAKVAITDTVSQQTPEWKPIRQTLQQAIIRFERANRLDLVALCIPLLERVLQKLQAWSELESAARKGLELHLVYGTQTRLSQDYGFLARAMLERQQWAAAREAANQALAELIDEPEDRNWLRGLYQLFLAQVERQLGNPEVAIANLKEANARDVSDRGYPKIAIRILQELWEMLFECQQYLEAFQAKQERLSIEQQYGIRAFVGSGGLQPQRQAVIAEFQAPMKEMVAPEVSATGRQRDLERLVERVARRDYRLIVIHGSSGVGKSSLVNAGLVPTLKQKSIEAKDNVPVVIRVYTQWVRELGGQLAEAIGSTLLDTQPLTTQMLLDQLRQIDQRNLRTVLIFDQFEEFFFVYPKPEQRRSFFEFLSQCLQILSIKVFLSLREDYLHLLLECNRIEGIRQTGIDILSQNVLFGLGNFERQDAAALIQSLTKRTQFFLEPDLVEQLVEDLAQKEGTVHPIELQVVGAQLQSEGITTLKQYKKLGPKEKFIERSIEEIIADCGYENEDIAWKVLYLLTDEKGNRPLKTKDEIAYLSGEEIEKINFILDVLTGSGLASKRLEESIYYYRLTYDYPAWYILRNERFKSIFPLFIKSSTSSGILVDIKNCETNSKVSNRKAFIDMKSDRTWVPIRILREIDAKPIGSKEYIKGLSTKTTQPYLIRIKPEEYNKFYEIEVFESDLQVLKLGMNFVKKFQV